MNKYFFTYFETLGKVTVQDLQALEETFRSVSEQGNPVQALAAVQHEVDFYAKQSADVNSQIQVAVLQ